MKPENIVRLEGEDLARWRQVGTRLTGLEMNPGAYSQSETEAIINSRTMFYAELVERYGIDDTRNWALSMSSGLVYYDD